MKKIPVFPFQETPTLLPSPFSRIGISSGTAVLEKCQNKRRSFLEWTKNVYLVTDPQKTKVDQNC